MKLYRYHALFYLLTFTVFTAIGCGTTNEPPPAGQDGGAVLDGGPVMDGGAANLEIVSAVFTPSVIESGVNAANLEVTWTGTWDAQPGFVASVKVIWSAFSSS